LAVLALVALAFFWVMMPETAGVNRELFDQG
jgi:hypothetical protein